MIRISFQREKCIGCNACVEAAFSRWRMSRRDGKSVLLGAVQKGQFHSMVAGDDEWDENQKAAANCAVKIIRVERL